MSDKIKGKAWKTEYDHTMKDESSEFSDDFVHSLTDATVERDSELIGADLSSLWSKRKKKHEDPEKIVYDLMNIRDTLSNLLKIHGLPKNTTIDIAGISSIGAGCAGFKEIGGSEWAPVLKKPYIFIDKSLYNEIPEDVLLDVYCGVGIHEASHLNHTKKMFLRLHSGKLTGELQIWEGLLEDERIEQLARTESPGYSPYLHAAKKALFEGKELGNALANWKSVPDKDKAAAIICSVLRVPYLLAPEQKEWVTIKGTNVYKKLRTLLHKLPKSEEDVEEMGAKLKVFWEAIEKEYEDAKREDDSALALEYAEKTGKLKGKKDASKDSSKSDRSDSSKDSEDTDPGESSSDEGCDSSSKDDSSDKEDGEKSEESGETPKKTKSVEDLVEEAKKKREDKAARESILDDVKKEIELRKLRQKIADMHDEETKKLLDGITRSFEKAKSSTLDTSSSAETVKSILDAGTKGEEKVESAGDKIEHAEKLKKMIEEDRLKKFRFSLEDLKRMIDRSSTVTTGISDEESIELAKAESEKLEFGDAWSVSSDHYGMGGETYKSVKRRTIIRHPEPTLERKKKYDAAKSSIAEHIAKMKAVFRLRLGKRVCVQSELVEGKLHRKMLSKASITDKIFSRSYVKTDPGLSLCVVLDESGSMYSSGKYLVAMKVAILIAESLQNVPGVELEICSFTSCGEIHEDCLINYLYGKENFNLASIGSYFERRGENYDHIALETIAKLFIRNTTNKNRLMLVLSDGYPAGRDYGGAEAIRLTKKAVENIEKQNISVLQIAIESFDSGKMFKHFLKFTDLNTLINKMRVLITTIVRKSTRG